MPFPRSYSRRERVGAPPKEPVGPPELREYDDLGITPELLSKLKLSYEDKSKSFDPNRPTGLKGFVQRLADKRSGNWRRRDAEENQRRSAHARAAELARSDYYHALEMARHGLDEKARREHEHYERSADYQDRQWRQDDRIRDDTRAEQTRVDTKGYRDSLIEQGGKPRPMHPSEIAENYANARRMRADASFTSGGKGKGPKPYSAMDEDDRRKERAALESEYMGLLHTQSTMGPDPGSPKSEMKIPLPFTGRHIPIPIPFTGKGRTDPSGGEALLGGYQYEMDDDESAELFESGLFDQMKSGAEDELRQMYEHEKSIDPSFNPRFDLPELKMQTSAEPASAPPPPSPGIPSGPVDSRRGPRLGQRPYPPGHDDPAPSRDGIVAGGRPRIAGSDPSTQTTHADETPTEGDLEMRRTRIGHAGESGRGAHERSAQAPTIVQPEIKGDGFGGNRAKVVALGKAAVSPLVPGEYRSGEPAYSFHVEFDEVLKQSRMAGREKRTLARPGLQDYTSMDPTMQTFYRIMDELEAHGDINDVGLQRAVLNYARSMPDPVIENYPIDSEGVPDPRSRFGGMD